MRLKPYLILSFLFLSFTNVICAQQFDWVTGGGTTSDYPIMDTNPEAAKYMCTDSKGNLYALSIMGAGTIYADTFNNAGNSLSAQNFLISSYTYNGTMRWAKWVGSNSGACVPSGIVVDSFGNLYVGSYVSNANLYIGTDTTITGLQYEHLGLMKFDTSGNFDWIRFIGDNTVASLEEGYLNAIALDGSENVHFFCYIGDGVSLPNGSTSQYGDYDFTYNGTGNVLNTTRLDMDSEWVVKNVTIDPITDRLYTTGEKNVYITGNPNEELVYAAFVAAFDTNSSLLWIDTVGNAAAALNGIVYDGMGHIYTGVGGSGSFDFNGMAVPAGATAIIKADTAGHPLWVQGYNIAGSSVNGVSELTLLSNNLIAATGLFAGDLFEFNGPFSITTSPGEGQNPFITILDTSGVVKSLDQIHGDGFYDWGLAITSDKAGNVYLGGQVEDSIWADNGNTSIPAYHSVGGNTDFFIMKYGMDCNCTSMPVANYSDTGSLTKYFAYTGTTTGVDSVVWDFGDGSAMVNSMNPVTHTYDSGSYEACVYAYSSCGSDMHCSKVIAQHSEGVENIEKLGVSVYPNPATNELTISVQLTGITYKLLNVTGSIMQTGSLNQGNNTISVNAFASGVYLLQLINNYGTVKMIKIVKE